MKNKHSGIVLASPNAEPVASGKERTHRPIDGTTKVMSPAEKRRYATLVAKLRQR